MELVNLALPSVALAELRVAERVAHGGHNIPVADIRRRFPRSLQNLLGDCGRTATRTRCFMNGGETPATPEPLMNSPSISNNAMLGSLRQAVAQALERKRRLGQYAVVWRQGQPLIVEGRFLPITESTSTTLREDAAPYASPTPQD